MEIFPERTLYNVAHILPDVIVVMHVLCGLLEITNALLSHVRDLPIADWPIGSDDGVDSMVLPLVV